MSDARGEARLSREQVRAVDRLAIEELGMPGLLLMEDAGLGATLAMLDEFGPWNSAAEPILVLCGGGNNGGDGWVVARQLVCRAVPVRVASAVDPARLPPDAAEQRRLALACGVPTCPTAELESALQSATAVVDALLGTGFRGQVREPVASWIELLNRARRDRELPVIALDLPSGLDADTGQASGQTVRADLTTTFVARKLGFDREGAQALTGKVIVIPIGTPPVLIERSIADASQSSST